MMECGPEYFMKVDVHWHHVPEAYLDRLRAGDHPSGDTVETDANGVDHLVMPRLRVPLPPELCSAPAAIAELDRRGLDMALVSPSPTLYQYQLGEDDAEELAPLANRGISDLVKEHPDRFMGLGTVPLQHPGRATAWLRTCMEQLGLKGAMIGTNVQGMNLDDASLADFFAEADRLGAYLFVHPLAVLGPERLGRYYLTNLIGNPTETTIAFASLVFGGILDRQSNIRFCFAHGGGMIPYQVGRLDRGYAVRPECEGRCRETPSEYLRRVYFDSLTHGREQLRSLVRIVGADRIMLGSDYPFDMGDEGAASHVIGLSLPGPEEQAILGGNCQELFAISS
jgi:aminocarboxymuconate-semialdehyde decarboxylase